MVLSAARPAPAKRPRWPWAALALALVGCGGPPLVAPAWELSWPRWSPEEMALLSRRSSAGAPLPDFTPPEVRTRVSWEAPSPRVMEVLDIPTDDDVPSYGIRRRVEQLRRAMLSDEGGASERTAEVVVRVVAANFTRQRVYACGNAQVGAAAVGVALEARGRLRNGEAFATVAGGGACQLPRSSSAEASFSTCMDEAVAAAFIQVMQAFGARVRRHGGVVAR